MITWKYAEKMGVFYITNAYTKETEKIEFLGGNCLGVLIHRWKDQETGKKYYNFINWFNDVKSVEKWLKHLKEDGLLTSLKKVKLNTYYKTNLKLINLFLKYGVKVGVFYNEIK